MIVRCLFSQIRSSPRCLTGMSGCDLHTHVHASLGKLKVGKKAHPIFGSRVPNPDLPDQFARLVNLTTTPGLLSVRHRQSPLARIRGDPAGRHCRGCRLRFEVKGQPAAPARGTSSVLSLPAEDPGRRSVTLRPTALSIPRHRTTAGARFPACQDFGVNPLPDPPTA